MKKRITITDIALKLGISSSTVSRALKDSPNISARVKQRIVAEAKSMGYGRIDSLAINNNIAIVVPTLNSTFYTTIIDSIESQLKGDNHLISVHCSYNSTKREKEILALLDREHTSCLIISKSMDSLDSEHIYSATVRGIPTIMFNRVDYAICAPKFVINNYEESYQATKHLISAGYKEIAFVAKHFNCSIYKERERAYRDALSEEGITFNPQLLIYSEQKNEDIVEVISRFFSLKQRPDAIILPNYFAALQAIHLAKLHNIDVPNDLGVFSFDEEGYCKYNSPAITSIERPLSIIGNDIGALAKKIINNEKYDTETMSPCYISNLVVRASTLRRD